MRKRMGRMRVVSPPSSSFLYASEHCTYPSRNAVGWNTTSTQCFDHPTAVSTPLRTWIHRIGDVVTRFTATQSVQAELTELVYTFYTTFLHWNITRLWARLPQLKTRFIVAFILKLPMSQRSQQMICWVWLRDMIAGAPNQQHANAVDFDVKLGFFLLIIWYF